MKKENINELFFCRNHDFLHVYIPKQQNGSEHTKKTYKSGMKSFRSYVNDVAGVHTNKFKFSDCTYDFLLDYRNYLHDEKKYAESTCNNKLAVIKSYMNYAAARDVSLQQYAFAIGQVPFLTVPKKMQPIIENIDALSSLLSMPPNTRKGLRDKVIMSVLYDSAIRVEELVSIQIREITITAEGISIKIHGKGNKERTVELDERTAALVKQYLGETHPRMSPDDYFIFTVVKGAKGPMSTRNVQKLIKRYADKVKEEYDLPDTVSPHTFRRTRGTLLYRDGVSIEEVSRMLGHSDIQTTRDHYTSSSPEQKRKIASKKNEAIPDEVQLWPDDEDELDAILGF